MTARTLTSRLAVRLSPEILVLVKRAAGIQGRSVSDFVRTAAQEAAQRAIDDDIFTIQLSIEDQHRMMAAILAPPEPNAALRKAMRAHRRLVIESR